LKDAEEAAEAAAGKCFSTHPTSRLCLLSYIRRETANRGGGERNSLHSCRS
jgi:hypothetical protein